jgi:hypothetical protein
MDNKIVLAAISGAVAGIALMKLLPRAFSSKKEEEGEDAAAAAWATTEDALNDAPVRFRYAPPKVAKVSPTASDDPVLEKDGA